MLKRTEKNVGRQNRKMVCSRPIVGIAGTAVLLFIGDSASKGYKSIFASG
jgi:hypothetical protein